MPSLYTRFRSVVFGVLFCPGRSLQIVLQLNYKITQPKFSFLFEHLRLNIYLVLLALISSTFAFGYLRMSLLSSGRSPPQVFFRGGGCGRPILVEWSSRFLLVAV